MKKTILMIISAATLSCAVSTYASDAKDTPGPLINNMTDIQWTKQDDSVKCSNVTFNATLPANKITPVTVDITDTTPCYATYEDSDGANKEITIIWTGSELEASSDTDTVEVDPKGIAVEIKS